VVAQAARDETEHLALARGELGQAQVAAVPDQRLAGQAVDHAAGDRGREERLAGRDGVDGGDEILRTRALEQEAAGARLQRAVARAIDGLAPVGGLVDDVDALVAGEHGPQPGAHQVVDQEDTNRRRGDQEGSAVPGGRA
jgi:hypothetical protein